MSPPFCSAAALRPLATVEQNCAHPVANACVRPWSSLPATRCRSSKADCESEVNVEQVPNEMMMMMMTMMMIVERFNHWFISSAYRKRGRGQRVEQTGQHGAALLSRVAAVAAIVAATAAAAADAHHGGGAVASAATHLLAARARGATGGKRYRRTRAAVAAAVAADAAATGLRRCLVLVERQVLRGKEHIVAAHTTLVVDDKDECNAADLGEF